MAHRARAWHLLRVFLLSTAVITVSACFGGDDNPKIDYICPNRPIAVDERAQVLVTLEPGLASAGRQFEHESGWEWALISIDGGMVDLSPASANLQLEDAVGSGNDNVGDSTWITGLVPGQVTVVLKQPEDMPPLLFVGDDPCTVIGVDGTGIPGSPTATVAAAQTPTATPLPIVTPGNVGSRPNGEIDPNERLAAGRVGLWHFDGDAQDSSGNGNHGVASPGVKFTAGVFGEALDLELGAEAFVQVPDSPSLNPTEAISIQVWYGGPAFYGAGNNGLIDKGAVSHAPPFYQYHLGVTGMDYRSTLNGNELGFQGTFGGRGRGAAVAEVQPGFMYHLMFTYDGSEVVYYINGAPVGTWRISGSLPAYGDPGFGTDLFFGTYANLQTGSDSHYVPGTVDEVAIWERALTGTEVVELYERGLAE